MTFDPTRGETWRLVWELVDELEPVAPRIGLERELRLVVMGDLQPA